MAIVDVNVALLLVQGTKTVDGEELRLLVELHSVPLSLLFIRQMNSERRNEAQRLMKVEDLCFDVTILKIISCIHL